MEFIFFALAILVLLAIFDLVVGVSNDAVNFLNSAIGSKVASGRVILIVASLGILAGVTFSSGMMEVARKGIFHPEFFTLPEILIIFTAVMLTDILLLDLFNTMGLPTSTTVSIIFELLGASVAVSLIKIYRADGNFAQLGGYINTAKVLAILSGILLSVVISFTAGLIVQFISRMIFTFDFSKRLKRYGAVWGGLALTMIVYFILIKGAKDASFLTREHMTWINANSLLILGSVFAVSAVIIQVLLLATNINILKPIVLAGTFALAMAFAANDLVNFIGVPLAGFSAYASGIVTANPLAATMEALKDPVKTDTILLLLAGLIMVLTLWFSKKARTVTKTEVNLGRQDEGSERFEAFFLAQAIVRMGSGLMEGLRKIMPRGLVDAVNRRKDITQFQPVPGVDGETPSFDLVRASVNMMVASALISFATSLKLPLSTTYVTFMVAMGASLADGAWDRESAVYRVSGVLTVIGGWFFTAFMAFTAALGYAFIIYQFGTPGLAVLAGLSAYLLWRNHRKHAEITATESSVEVYNLKKNKDPRLAVTTSFEQTGKLLEQVSKSLKRSFSGLRSYDRVELRVAKGESKKIQNWTNIIIANIFKALRILHQTDIRISQRYAQTINNLQEIAESQRDVSMRSWHHVNNHHKGLLKVQITELEQVLDCVTDLLEATASSLKQDTIAGLELIGDKVENLSRLISEFDKNQIGRVQNESSKTRLSILFYSYLVSASKISSCTRCLLEIFNEFLELDSAKEKKGG
jgi:phosphate/sulfate permease